MNDKVAFGSTGRKISRIGISTSFGADRQVYDAAFERGCNYFTWGTFIKGRATPFKYFVRDVISNGKREELFISLLSYSHTAFLGDIFLHSALKQLKTDYVDGLILGYFSKKPSRRLLEWAQRAKEKGFVRSLGVTTHNRKIVTQLAAEDEFDFIHFRYNAAHRGAEQDIFPGLPDSRPGTVSFTATCWGKLVAGNAQGPSAGDCYRFVLGRSEIDCCMMGVKDVAMLNENLDEIEKGPLSGDRLKRLLSAADAL